MHLLCLATVFVAPIAFVVSAEDAPVVETPVGSIAGWAPEAREGAPQVQQFLGIPYAKPPVGELRFALPQPYGSVGAFNATQFGRACPQPTFAGDLPRPPASSEDCLTLNVFRKAGTKEGDNKAVVVIFHGGAFTGGASSTPLYSPRSLVTGGDLVAVSFNYRLGVLGFGDMGDLAPGNLGLHDQRLVLQWIQENIRSFGGDPDKVTLMGVSAGAMSVSAQIMSPLNREGKKLFHAVIMDGGVMGPGIMTESKVSVHRMKSIASAVGCATEGAEMLDCLRKADVDKLVQASYEAKEFSPIFTLRPTSDGKFLPKNVLDEIKNNATQFLCVRMLIGYTKDEGSMFGPESVSFTGNKYPNGVSDEEFDNVAGKLASAYKMPFHMKEKFIKNVRDTYFGKTSSHAEDLDLFTGDGLVGCPTNEFLKGYSSAHHNVYAYRFDRKLHKGYLMLTDPSKVGAMHASGYIHMSGLFLEMPEPLLDANDRAYFLDGVKMVAEFAKSDEAPKFRGLQLPNFSKGEGVMVFDDESHVEANLSNEDRCKSLFTSDVHCTHDHGE